MSRPGLPSGGPSSGRSERDYGLYRGDNASLKTVSSAGYSSSRERRAGGYGGFYENGSAASSASFQSSEQQFRPSSRPRRYDTETGTAGSIGGGRDETRYGDRGKSQDRNRSDATSGRSGPQPIDDVLRMIQQDWEFMATDDCIPVQVGLQLMDSSTLGKADREPDFIRTYKQIQKSLKSIVNEHHQGFNSSIGTYHTIQSSIQSSQNRLRILKGTLAEAKAGLLTTKPELKGLATASQNYDDILQLFSQIENIQSLPEKLEARVSEKRFIAAVEILKDALRLVNKPEFDGIGGLRDLRTYFSNQELSLTDILIEELHDHLYLKSPYCQDRWKLTTGDEAKDGPKPPGLSNVTHWDRPVYHFLANLDMKTPVAEDASRNPETDTFHYIRVVIEALNKMGNLELAVDRIEQRLPVELFAIVDKTGSEVAARYPEHRRSQQPRDSTVRCMPNELGGDRGYVLSEFMWNLYAKFEAIAEGHRIVHDVVAGIVERENIRKSGSLTSGFKELWKLYQSEIRSLLHDYLATDGEVSYRAQSNISDDKYTQTSNKRDRTKKLFKLSEVDEKSSDMKAEQNELEEILRSSVPGLVSKSRQKTSTTDSSRSRQENSGTGHKLLIEPSVFNMSLLLPPSLSFIQRLKDIVPLTSDIVMSTLTSFLDDFLINVFQPQLDEAVTDLCAMTFIALDAFTEDPQWTRVSRRPIFKGTIAFMELVKTFCKMLNRIPHDQAFTQLVIHQIVTYYDKCYGMYKALVARVSAQHTGGLHSKAAAAYAESGEIRETTEQLWECTDDKQRQELIAKEIDLLIKYTNETPLESYDIVSDPKTVFSLSLLYNSMQWLVNSLSRLRHITTHETDSNRLQSTGRIPLRRRWTLLSSMNHNRDSSSIPNHLPMTEDSVIIFDTTLQSLQDLALTALLTLHIDIRCGAIHMVTHSLSSNTSPSALPATPPSSSKATELPHVLLAPPSSASPAIIELNNDLITFDANAAMYLGPNECRFITSGLAQLIDRAFISATRFIGAMNHNGALRLQLDVLVLQQNLKNIIVHPSPPPPSSSSSSHTTKETAAKRPSSQPEPGQEEEVVALPRSAKFLDWFLDGAEKALENAQAEQEEFKTHGTEKALQAGNGEPFTYEEMRVLVELCYSAILKGPAGRESSREDFLAAKRACGDALLRLSEFMWDS
ncbi:Sec8 exocyst complex component specific domain-containing protein [Histoplasma capsulatum var. duboisii H88]|uniref:Exocyst complex component Sec8 n=1 Tax=Ajellomyces capsulatus (strain H88) TaxID=544711 RepID=A0A8A1LN28_AJEC8|nr:Sec8 exocyst complex component specific domain-containing protein [Histoplasma capsulatum var. duboisii H88]